MIKLAAMAGLAMYLCACSSQGSAVTKIVNEQVGNSQAETQRVSANTVRAEQDDTEEAGANEAAGASGAGAAAGAGENAVNTGDGDTGVNAAAGDSDTGANAAADGNAEVNKTAAGSGEPAVNGAAANGTDGIDVDLTKMSSIMVYSEVYNMMVEPETYIGKTIKIQGPYYASYWDQTDNYYHYVIIEDATACCTQGLEFIWDNNEHQFPDEYPEDYTEVEISGTFNKYEEEGQEFYYIAASDIVIK